MDPSGENIYLVGLGPRFVFYIHFWFVCSGPAVLLMKSHPEFSFTSIFGVFVLGQLFATMIGLSPSLFYQVEVTQVFSFAFIFGLPVLGQVLGTVIGFSPSLFH